MTDLFAVAAEMAEERAGILEFVGMLTRTEANRLGLLESERWREACEVRDILNKPLADRQDYLADVKRKRGKAAAEKLGGLVRDEWMRRKSA